ncbi:chorismate mutase aro7 [Physocladia obscura]|uniref:chorismate mutase n=1 Tax=Physocladia obscura TaxID=109957 RepID=A0AAD5TFS6_9FUNG|nr:chorismate mutase aro7 [Physocladia obscura]
MSNFHTLPLSPTAASASGTLDKSFLNLDRIREELVQMEDSIVFGFVFDFLHATKTALIERAAFGWFLLLFPIHIELALTLSHCNNPEAQNNCTYTPNHENFEFYSPTQSSFLDYFFAEMEAVHAKVRRYTAPDQYPFTTNLPKPVLPPLIYPQLLYPNNINLNARLKDIYIEKVIPSLCKFGDDRNYGSSATKDIDALQVLSRRIHFGKFVAEAKFQDPKTQAEYIRLIKLKDRAGINALLTNLAVEERLLKRLRLKALIFGQEIGDGYTGSDISAAMDETTWQHKKDDGSSGGESDLKKRKLGGKIDPNLVVSIYEQFVIPLTKEVEVEYLMGRLEFPDFKPSV